MTNMPKDKDDTRIALINNNLEYMKSDISDIKQAVKELSGVYATQQQLKELGDQVGNLSKTLEDISNKQNGLQRFITPIISSAATGIIVVLVINFLQHH